MTPLGPSGFPHDLERFRPVEREEVKDSIHKICLRIPLTPSSTGAGVAGLPDRDACDAARLPHGQGRPADLAGHSQGGVRQEEGGGGGC